MESFRPVVCFVSNTPSAVQYRVRILLRNKRRSSLLFLQPGKTVYEWPNYGLSTMLLKNSFFRNPQPRKTVRLKILQYVWTSYYFYLHTKQRTSFLNHKTKVNKHANHGTACHTVTSSAEIFQKSSNKKCTLFMFYAWRLLLCSNPSSQHENTDRISKAVGTIACVNVCEFKWLMTVHLNKKRIPVRKLSLVHWTDVCSS